MEVKQQNALNTSKNVHVFEGALKMSLYQPIDVKPLGNQKWLTNGVNNSNYKVYKDAYDDSPTNASIINAFVNYIYAEGLINTSENAINLKKYISKKDVLLICKDYKIYGGFTVQVIWNELKTAPVRIEYIPVYKIGVNLDDKMNVNGYWYCWDWTQKGKYKPTLYPKYTGKYTGNDLEILMVRNATAEPFFPVPDYLSGINWARVEGELGNSAINHFKNALSALTIVNYNNGRIQDDEIAKGEAKKVREKVVGTDNQSAVIVSFNEGAEEAVTVDQLHPPELNQQNVFFSEEAEKKLIIAHSVPPILFAGSNTGSGFSSNADEMKEAIKALYRRHINPSREVILDGLHEVFEAIDASIKLDFKDFEEEDELTTEEV